MNNKALSVIGVGADNGEGFRSRASFESQTPRKTLGRWKTTQMFLDMIYVYIVR